MMSVISVDVASLLKVSVAVMMSLTREYANDVSLCMTVYMSEAGHCDVSKIEVSNTCWSGKCCQQ